MTIRREAAPCGLEQHLVASPAMRPLAETRVFLAAEDVAAALRGGSVEYVSLAAGPYHATLTQMDLRGTRLQHAIDAPHMTRATVAAGQAVILLPLGPVGETRVNGRPIAAGDAVVLGPGSDILATVGTALTWGSVALSLESAEALGIDLPPAGQFRHMPDLLARFPVLPASFSEVIAAGRTRADLMPGTPATGALAEDLHRAIGLALTAAPGRTGASRAIHRRMALVRRADDYMHSTLGRPIDTQELCTALGVADRSLRAAFAAVHGISPHAYLRLRRLDLVRARLLRTPRMPGRVKAAALSHGFWHLGRFSAEYQERFGESPSRTGPGAVLDDDHRGALAAMLRRTAARSP